MFALFRNGKVLMSTPTLPKKHYPEVLPKDVAAPSVGAGDWYSVVEVGKESFNPTYQEVVGTEYSVAGDTLTITYTVADKPLAECKQIKSAIINSERDGALESNTPVNVLGHNWDTRKKDRDNISGVVAYIGAGGTIPPGYVWRNADNQDVVVDAAGLVQIGAAMMGYVSGVYADSWARKAAVENASSVAEVVAA